MNTNDDFTVLLPIKAETERTAADSFIGVNTNRAELDDFTNGFQQDLKSAFRKSVHSIIPTGKHGWSLDVAKMSKSRGASSTNIELNLFKIVFFTSCIFLSLFVHFASGEIKRADAERFENARNNYDSSTCVVLLRKG